MITTFQAELRALGACTPAYEWAEGRTAAEAWDECPRADWLVWYAVRKGVDRRCVLTAVCEIIRLVPGPIHPTLIVVERWCAGADVSQGELRDAARAARAAAYAAAYAAYAAAYTADAVDAAAYAADAVYAATSAGVRDAVARAIVHKHILEVPCATP